MAQQKRSPAPVASGDGATEQDRKLIDRRDDTNIAAVEQAAAWYARHRDECPHPVIPALRRRFGLTAVEAARALSLAGRAP